MNEIIKFVRSYYSLWLKPIAKRILGGFIPKKTMYLTFDLN